MVTEMIALFLVSIIQLGLSFLILFLGEYFDIKWVRCIGYGVFCSGGLYLILTFSLGVAQLLIWMMGGVPHGSG